MDQSSVARDCHTKWVEGVGVFDKTRKTVACLKGIIKSIAVQEVTTKLSEECGAVVEERRYGPCATLF